VEVGQMINDRKLPWKTGRKWVIFNCKLTKLTKLTKLIKLNKLSQLTELNKLNKLIG